MTQQKITKALAMSQPWAELLVSGKKRIEVRTRNTSHRGWFYVYAARKDTKEDVVRKFGYTELPTGVIIGKAFLKDVKSYGSDQEFYADSPHHLATPEIIELEGWNLKTKFGYIIENPRRIPPIPWRGMPGFFSLRGFLIES